MPKKKTLSNYKKVYEFETRGQSAEFRVGWLQGALASTNNKQIRQWLQDEIYVVLKGGN